MEKISSGITPSNWEIVVTCPRCGSKYKVKCKDISIWRRSKNTLLSKKYYLEYSVSCGDCNSDIVIDESRIPPVIRRAIVNNLDIVHKLLFFYFE